MIRRDRRNFARSRWRRKMGKYSRIEWTDHTFNPWIGCQKVSPGCDNCYAEAMMDHRYKRVQWGPHGERQRTSEQNWRLPIRWNAEARAFRKENGHRPRVFVLHLPTFLTIGSIPRGAMTCSL